MSEDPPSAHRRSSRSIGTEHVDRAIRADLEAGDVAGAVADTIAAYGREIFGFVTAAVAERRAGQDAYARFVATLPHELPRFAWGCRLRTFTYFLARRELRRTSGRTATAPRVISVEIESGLPGSKDRPRRSLVAAVRRCLAPEDRELLVLRIDRGLDWHEIALTSLGEHATERDIAAESDELHQRFLILRMQVERLTRRALGRRAVRPT
jgi:RNA polymerase sigma-70 factor (ECF subfamily)